MGARKASEIYLTAWTDRGFFRKSNEVRFREKEDEGWIAQYFPLRAKLRFAR